MTSCVDFVEGILQIDIDNTDRRCFAQWHWDGSGTVFFSSFAVSGHHPNICHLLYDIKLGSLTKRNNTCTVSIGRRAEREDEGVMGKRKRRDKEKEIFNNVCVLMWERVERVWVCDGGKKGRETLKSGTVCECVCECVFCDLLPGKAPSD